MIETLAGRVDADALLVHRGRSVVRIVALKRPLFGECRSTVDPNEASVVPRRTWVRQQ